MGGCRNVVQAFGRFISQMNLAHFGRLRGIRRIERCIDFIHQTRPLASPPVLAHTRMCTHCTRRKACLEAKVPKLVMSSSPSTRFDGSDIDGSLGPRAPYAPICHSICFLVGGVRLGWRPLLVGWRPLLVGWRLLLVGCGGLGKIASSSSGNGSSFDFLRN